MQIVFILCRLDLRYPPQGFLLPPEQSGDEENLVGGAHSSEKLHFKNLFFLSFFKNKKIVPFLPFQISYILCRNV